MRKTLFAWSLIFILLVNSFASPLVFKTSKEVTTGEWTEIGTFDATKYSQIRIGILSPAKKLDFEYRIYGVEDGEKILLSGNAGDTTPDNSAGKRFVIESPASQISVEVKGKKGLYRLFVWGNQ